jgi:plasmid stabilization system protein ParE
VTPYRIIAGANDDILAAASWYQQEASRGREFTAAVFQTIEKICEDPSSHQTVRGVVRRRRILAFPYDVLFEAQPEFVRVIAVAHHQRKPGFWRGRLSDS